MSIVTPQVPRRLNLKKETPRNLQDVPLFLKELVQALNRQQELVSVAIQGLTGADVLANRPPSAVKGRLFYATDVAHFYVDNGTAWQLLV